MVKRDERQAAAAGDQRHLRDPRVHHHGHSRRSESVVRCHRVGHVAHISHFRTSAGCISTRHAGSLLQLESKYYPTFFFKSSSWVLDGHWSFNVKTVDKCVVCFACSKFKFITRFRRHTTLLVDVGICGWHIIITGQNFWKSFFLHQSVSHLYLQPSRTRISRKPIGRLSAKALYRANPQPYVCGILY